MLVASIFSLACFQAIFYTTSRRVIWTPGAPKSKFSLRRYCKTHVFTEIVFYGSRGRCSPLFWMPWEQFYWFLLPWKQAGKFVDFRWCNGFWGRRGSGEITHNFGPVHSLTHVNCLFYKLRNYSLITRNSKSIMDHIFWFVETEIFGNILAFPRRISKDLSKFSWHVYGKLGGSFCRHIVFVYSRRTRGPLFLYFLLCCCKCECAFPYLFLCLLASQYQRIIIKNLLLIWFSVRRL